MRLFTCDPLGSGLARLSTKGEFVADTGKSSFRICLSSDLRGRKKIFVRNMKNMKNVHRYFCNTILLKHINMLDEVAIIFSLLDVFNPSFKGLNIEQSSFPSNS